MFRRQRLTVHLIAEQVKELRELLQMIDDSESSELDQLITNHARDLREEIARLPREPLHSSPFRCAMKL
jgi:hypothetical protein